ncbi:MAG: dephospho-CoA kinase [Gammaproteobacteria bacterium]|nr:MAG: dephospho-CoA kinase [Gammaproteobacteria bacterium]
MLKIGLTGGIGSGKSTVAEAFARLGVPVLDADRIAHELTAPGSPLLEALRPVVPPDCFTPEGVLDRRCLRERAFRDPGLRRRLEAVLHPAIRARLLERAAATRAPYVLFVVPLLIEAGWQDLVDRILVVDVPEAIQVQRVCARDHSTPDEVQRILQAQCDRATRLRAADDLLDNTGDRNALAAQVEQLHRRYLALAGERGSPPAG